MAKFKYVINGESAAAPVVDAFDGIVSAGLTKREAFALAAMQGTTACDVNNELTVTDIVEQAVAMADALLKELSK